MESAPRGLVWQPSSQGHHGRFAVHAGVDSGRELYVVRAHHERGIIPGKLHVGHTSAYIAYGGQEFPKSSYEVLLAPPGSLSWVDCQGSNIPSGAIHGGRDPNGEDYFIGRAIHNGTVTVGKVQRSHGTCYVPHGGKEHAYKNYEILVRNAYGKYLNI